MGQLNTFTSLDAPDVQTFNFEGHTLSVQIKDGKPWWVASEVLRVLGLAHDARNFTRYLDPSESALYGLHIRSENGTVQGRKLIHVSESGLYSLIFKSRKPEAKRFRLWVTSEVLPSIRKTGQYSVAEAPAHAPAPPIAAKPEISVSALVELLDKVRIVPSEARASNPLAAGGSLHSAAPLRAPALSEVMP